MKLTKPYGSGNDNASQNSASYSGYGIAKGNKYQPNEVSNLVFCLVNYLSIFRFQQGHVFKKKAKS